jgi:hypothetical protein
MGSKFGCIIRRWQKLEDGATLEELVYWGCALEVHTCPQPLPLSLLPGCCEASSFSAIMFLPA